MTPTATAKPSVPAPVQFVLPWPPSVNHYWRHVGRRVLVSRAGRTYRAAVWQVTKAYQRRSAMFAAEPLAVSIACYFPDRRRRDLDNLLKSLLDALVTAKVYEDDSQIVDLHIRNAGEVTENGCVAITITTTPNLKKGV